MEIVFRVSKSTKKAPTTNKNSCGKMDLKPPEVNN
jgi:hypothetical protein